MKFQRIVMVFGYRIRVSKRWYQGHKDLKDDSNTSLALIIAYIKRRKFGERD
jgi:hypothetical protein